ncbi:MAG: universal stress protein [Syntrophorhabdales bacterium]|jgi:nucleotide-binding universal stress UspA family protein
MTPQIKKILYATDLTKNSAYAFYFAADLARKHDAKIIMLHCIGTIPPSLYAEGGFPDVPAILKKAKEREAQEDVTEIKKRLEEFCVKVESQFSPPCVDLVSEVIVTAGYAVEEILNTADAKKCDVIVLGTHGKGWLKQSFLGSVASSVLERTRKPVFIIPLPSEKASIDWAAL